jgi:hypothetical protein
VLVFAILMGLGSPSQGGHSPGGDRKAQHKAPNQLFSPVEGWGHGLVRTAASRLVGWIKFPFSSHISHPTSTVWTDPLRHHDENGARRGGRVSGRAAHAKSRPDKAHLFSLRRHDQVTHPAKRSLLRRWFRRLAVVAGALVLLGGIGVLLVLFLGRPTVSVSASSQGLLNVRVGGLGTRLDEVHAANGDHPLSLVRTAGSLEPATELAQGQSVRVTAVASAPSWLRWLVGSKVSVSKTFLTPSAWPSAEIALASSPGHVPIDFDHSVSVVDYRVDNGPLEILRMNRPAPVADLVVPARRAAGSLQVVAAPLAWEKVSSRPTTISWFVPPASGAPVALVNPAPGSATATSNGPITLIFDEPVAKLFGSSRPTLSPNVKGTWSELDSNTLVFTPSDFGFGPGASVTVSFRQPISTIGAAAADITTAAVTSEHYTFDVAPGSILRMEQILAQLHYLPLNFVPATGVTEPSTFQGEVDTMSNPLPGSFSWRWSSTPETLRQQWSPGSPDTMLKGGLMAFDADQANNNYEGYQVEDETVGQLANASMWDELLHAAAADQYDPNPYSYVYVSENLPETLTLWKNGSVALTSLANTGIPAEPTALGTYPIYVRYTSNYMNGTNPDGSSYHDLVYWINYFNGSDAVHAFYRASYGSPQSLGCVELPTPTAQVAFTYLSIGDLVTVAA